MPPVIRHEPSFIGSALAQALANESLAQGAGDLASAQAKNISADRTFGAFQQGMQNISQAIIERSRERSALERQKQVQEQIGKRQQQAYAQEQEEYGFRNYLSKAMRTKELGFDDLRKINDIRSQMARLRTDENYTYAEGVLTGDAQKHDQTLQTRLKAIIDSAPDKHVPSPKEIFEGGSYIMSDGRIALFKTDSKTGQTSVDKVVSPTIHPPDVTDPQELADLYNRSVYTDPLTGKTYMKKGMFEPVKQDKPEGVKYTDALKMAREILQPQYGENAVPIEALTMTAHQIVKSATEEIKPPEPQPEQPSVMSDIGLGSQLLGSMFFGRERATNPSPAITAPQMDIKTARDMLKLATSPGGILPSMAEQVPVAAKLVFDDYNRRFTSVDQMSPEEKAEYELAYKLME